MHVYINTIHSKNPFRPANPEVSDTQAALNSQRQSTYLTLVNMATSIQTRFHSTSVSYCMVCAYVWEDNPRALASGLSPVHMHSHTITALM